MLISDDYKEIIAFYVHKNKSVKGYQKKLAQAAKVIPSFISQVLNGDRHLTADQAANLTKFWSLDTIQTEYFLTLVYLARCGSKSYQEFLEQKLREIKTKLQSEVKQREAYIVDKSTQIQYFTNWLFQAVHMLMTIPKYSSPQKIANRLKINESSVLKSLEILSEIGLVEKKNDRWIIIKEQLHLPKESMLHWNFQNAWRQYSMTKLSLDSADLNYTFVMSTSKKNYEKLKNLLIQLIAEADQIAKGGDEEEVYCLNLDFFII